MTLWAMAAMYPSQSTFHNLLSRDRAQPSRSMEANTPSTIVLRRTLSRRKADVRFRSCASRNSGQNIVSATYRRF